MFILVPILLFGWIPFVCLLFAIMPPRRAVVVGYLGAWMFLPVYGYDLPYLPGYTKVTAANIAVLLAASLFDSRTLRAVRPAWFDLPLLIYCLVPFAASLSNDLGAYDGMSNVLKRLVGWGIPYFIGRAYFTNVQAIRNIAYGVVIGGLIYIPLCLWEIRMSPMLHEQIFGFRQDPWHHAVRYGGFRPNVFMQTGLMVGMWMATATVMALWLWRRRAVQKLMGIPMPLVTTALFVTTVLCKSTYSVFLGLIGTIVIFVSGWTRTSLPMLMLVLVPPIYMTTRTTGMVPKDPLVHVAELISNEDRAHSLDYRLTQEVLFTEKALERPIFGWGGYNRFKPDEEDWRGGVDALWITTFGMTGLVGLITLTVAWLLPAILFLIRYPAQTWNHHAVAPVAALAVLLLMTMCDNLLNAMYNPIMTVIAGGLSSIYMKSRHQTPTPQMIAQEHLEVIALDQAAPPRQTHS